MMRTRTSAFALGSFLAVCLEICLVSNSLGEGIESKPPLVFAPINMPDKVITWKDQIKAQSAWCDRVLLAPFAERIKGKPWAKEALEYATFSLRFQDWVPERNPSPEQFAQGEKLMAAGCEDPLVIFLHDWFVARDSGRLKSYKALEAAYEKARAFPGPKALAWMLARLWNEFEGLAPREKSWRFAMELTGEVLKDGSFRPDEDLIFYRQLSAGPANKNYLFTRPDDFEFLSRAPELSEWAQQMFLASTQKARAFHRDARDPELLAQARVAATRAWELRPDRPDGPTEMMYIAKFDRERVGEHPRLWFDRAIAAQFDYFPAYIGLLDACSPEFDGSAELMLSMGEACLATGRTDTIVPQVYVLTLNRVAGLTRDWESVFRRPDTREKLMALSGKLLNDPNRAHARTLQTGLLAVNAWLVGDFATAAKARAAIPGPLPRMAIAKLQSFNITRFNEQMEFYGKPGSAEYFAGLEHRKHHRYPEAVAAFKTALEKVPPAWIETAKTQLSIAESEIRFATGEWMALPPSSDSHAWFTNPGLYNPWVDEKSHVSDAQKALDAAQKYLMLPLGNAVEIRGEWYMNKGVLSDAKAGTFKFKTVTPTDEPPYYHMADWFDVTIRKVSSPDLVITVDNGYGRPFSPPVPIKAEPTNRVQVLLKDGMVTVIFNDRPVIENSPVPKRGDRSQKVFGIVIDSQGRQAHPKLEIRLPQTAPARAPEPPAETVDPVEPPLRQNRA